MISNNVTDWSATYNPYNLWCYGEKSFRYSPLIPYPYILAGLVGYSLKGLVSWYRYNTDGHYTPRATKNVSDKVISGIAPGEILLHPGPDRRPSVLRWTAPGSGTFSVAGWFGAGDVGSCSYEIQHNDISVWYQPITGSTVNFNLSVTVVAGDILDFQVAESYTFCSTPINVSIGACGFDWTYAGYRGVGLLELGAEKRAGYGFYIGVNEWNALIDWVKAQYIIRGWSLTDYPMTYAIIGQPFTAWQFNQVKLAIGSKVGTGILDKIPGDIIYAADLNTLRTRANLL